MTRRDALAYAFAEAAERSLQGLATSINVEGGDGLWRLVPPKAATQPRRRMQASKGFSRA